MSVRLRLTLLLCPTGRHSVALEPVSSWGAPETSTASKPQNSDTVPDIEGYTAQMRGWEARKLGLVARLLNSGLAVHELGAPSGAPSAMPSRPGTGGLKHKAMPAAFMPTGMATPEAVGPICTRKLLVQALVQESRALLAVFQRGNRRELRGKTALCVVGFTRIALALALSHVVSPRAAAITPDVRLQTSPIRRGRSKLVRFTSPRLDEEDDFSSRQRATLNVDVAMHVSSATVPVRQKKQQRALRVLAPEDVGPLSSPLAASMPPTPGTLAAMSAAAKKSATTTPHDRGRGVYTFDGPASAGAGAGAGAGGGGKVLKSPSLPALRSAGSSRQAAPGGSSRGAGSGGLFGMAGDEGASDGYDEDDQYTTDSEEGDGDSEEASYIERVQLPALSNTRSSGGGWRGTTAGTYDSEWVEGQVRASSPSVSLYSVGTGGEYDDGLASTGLSRLGSAGFDFG